MSNRVALYVDGAEYSGWKSVRITRGLTRATSDFDLTVSERWGLESMVWQLLPGGACEIRYGNEVMLSGFIDTYQPAYDSGAHNIRLSGRSKTCDFVDCSVLVDGGQFRGLTVGEIARQLAEPFGLGVKVIDDGEPEAEVQVQQGETCFALVERLSRLQAILVTDDADGNLVLTRAGSGRAATALRHGSNILAASANLDHSKRFSDILVKAQRPGNSNKSNDDAPTQDREADWQPTIRQSEEAYLAALEAVCAIPNVCERYRARMQLQRASGKRRGNPKSLTEIHGSVRDPDITRYRPMVLVAEAQSDDGLAEKRADWEMRRRMAEGTRAVITINGWLQQGGGALWEPNQMVLVASPWLALEREMIISEITYSYDDNGERSSMELTLPDAFLPAPERKAKGKPPPTPSQRAARKGITKRDPWADWIPTGQDTP